ncbi:hypothetical protein HII36_05130 [Nonomuraea sp. NN258]|uniref:S1 family peptidase n=1 Tax=Nonomuraea antri TaxID=2730852 RepID=UPI0015686F47|nr:S1 family peptidase [Nonomuraea antri]NRQ31219.1 hypothetical protein [Nonomuraea antri]
MLRRTTAAITLAIGLTAVPASAHASSNDPIVITGSPVERPTLERLKVKAAQSGSSLEEAIEQYATEASATATVKPNWPDGPPGRPEVSIDDLDLTEIDDLKGLAKTMGMSLEESIDRWGWSETFRDFSKNLRNRFPGEVAALAIVDNGRGAAVGFKGSIPSNVAELAKSLPVRVELSDNKGYTEQEFHDAVTRAKETVTAQPEVEIAEVSDANPVTGEITLKFKAKAAVRSTVSIESLQARTRDAVALATIRVGVISDDTLTGRVLEDQYIRGGGWLEQTLGTHHCTSGFNITNGTTRRSSTAEHCADAEYLWYNNHPTQGGDHTTISRMFRSPTYDVASYNQGGKTLTRTFYADLNDPRYADGWSYPGIGDPVCKYGRETGHTCSYVAHYSGSDGVWVTEHDISTGGDSGGPWFYNRIAYGIHMGKVGGLSSFTSVATVYSPWGANWTVWTR